MRPEFCEAEPPDRDKHTYKESGRRDADPTDLEPDVGLLPDHHRHVFGVSLVP